MLVLPILDLNSALDQLALLIQLISKRIIIICYVVEMGDKVVQENEPVGVGVQLGPDAIDLGIGETIVDLLDQCSEFSRSELLFLELEEACDELFQSNVLLFELLFKVEEYSFGLL